MVILTTTLTGSDFWDTLYTVYQKTRPIIVLSGSELQERTNFSYF